jgi:bifunctional non-homologous end joining protein LigD
MPESKEEPLIVEVDCQRLRITHPAKVMDPDEGITKAEILQYYLRIAPALMPHMQGRPVIIHAFPHGVKGRPYHRRWLAKRSPTWLSRVH